MDVIARLDCLKGLRGNERKPAEAVLMNDPEALGHIESALKGLSRAYQNPVSKLVVNAKWGAATEGAQLDGVCKLINAMLALKGARVQDGAVGALNRLGPAGTSCTSALLDSMSSRLEAHELIRAISALIGMKHSPEVLADWLTDYAQHPRKEVAMKVRELLHDVGREPGPYIYEGLYGTGVSEQMCRLGMEVAGLPERRTGVHPEYYSSKLGRHWSEVDPMGEFGPPKGPAWIFYEGLSCRQGCDFRIKGYRRTKDRVVFIHATENFDIVDDEGRRRLLAVVAYNEDMQIYYCVDLSDTEDLDIWVIDHDGSDPCRKCSAWGFLKHTELDKKRDKAASKTK